VGQEAEIKIASAKKGGYYHTFGSIITRQFSANANFKSKLLESKGSVHNSQLLLSQKADMAIMQTAAVAGSLKKLEVIAPLWHDYVHIIVRKSSKIKSLSDLIGKKVALGGSGSGHRASAARILPYYGIQLSQLKGNKSSYRNLLKDKSIDAAIVTTTLANPVIKKVMASGLFTLLPLPTAKGFAIHNSDYEATSIPAGVYSSKKSPLPAKSVPSLRTLAVLAAHKGLSDKAVTTMLNVIYSIDTRTQAPVLLTAKEGTEGLWLSLPINKAAHRFFDPSKTVTSLANSVEKIFANAQLGLFILLTIGALLFKIYLRNKQNIALAEEQNNSELKIIFQSLLGIEAKSKRARDVRVIREYLTELEKLKAQGVELIFNSSLKNSTMFSAFILQTNQVASYLDFLIANGGDLRCESPREDESVNDAELNNDTDDSVDVIRN
jgi:TRAP transporter TAXI family solute receptor